MKKLSVLILTIALVFGLSACGSKSETLEGYWMTETGETISFNSDGKAIVDGLSIDYSIYNENYLSLSFLGFAKELRFELKNDILTVIDLSDNSKKTFYRDEDKQAEIQENLNKIAAEQAEQERIQQELEAQAQAQEEHEKYVANLKSRIDSIDTEISWKQQSIRDNEGYIAEIKKSIQEEYDTINELENEISALQSNTDDLTPGKIEVLRGHQETRYVAIETRNEQIKTRNNEISRYKQEIADLESEKENIIKELKKLGEY